MRILDRYILKEVLLAFLFGIFAFSAVFIGSGTLFRIAQYVTQYGASFSSVVKLFIYSMPAIMLWTFPMSMLLSSLLVFGKLSGSSEITAMKSCGVSFYRLMRPIIIMGFIVSLFAIAFNEYVVPWANQAYADVINYEIKNNAKPQSQEHIILKEIKDGNIQRLIYARRYDAKKNRMERIAMQDFENGKLVRVENADYADYSGNEWILHNGIIYSISDGEMSHTMHFGTQKLPIREGPDSIIREQKKPEEMTMKELEQQIKIMKSQYVDTTDLEIELYQRITVPMASLIFTLIGAPLGMQPNRNSSSIGFGLSIIIIFIYYALMTIASVIGRVGIPPAYAVWLPNIIGAVIGIYLIRKAAR
ncbi:LptF/LptG family permease [Pectinatus sottacetonis]|uniref:LptF/LptG family permease n=1 Tax=Pectinatus sottacetonis TaxID=1002795 RepID=UPI0018C6F674|nr:LptF/LptG family permease [Pectinatus sottacetonis]